MSKTVIKALIGILGTVLGAILAAIVVMFLQHSFIFSSTYPNVTGQYVGSIHNTYLNVSSKMSLLFKKNGGDINGYFTVGPGLIGSGPFTGTVDSSGNIQFTAQSNKHSEPFSFSGTVGSNESISGTYCNLTKQNQCDPTGTGTWIVSRGSFSSSFNLQTSDTIRKKEVFLFNS